MLSVCRKRTRPDGPPVSPGADVGGSPRSRACVRARLAGVGDGADDAEAVRDADRAFHADALADLNAEEQNNRTGRAR